MIEKMAKKNKLSKEDLLKSQMLSYIDRTKQEIVNADTLWQPRMNELLPLFKQYLSDHPDEIDYVLKGFAWHAYHYALKPR